METFRFVALAVAVWVGMQGVALRAGEKEEIAELKARVEALENEVKTLKEELARVDRQQPRFAFQGIAARLGPIEGTGKPVTADEKLKQGAKLQIEWGGQWWAGEAIQVLKDGHVQVRYTGWGDQWDQVVPRDRLRHGGDDKPVAGVRGGFARRPFGFPAFPAVPGFPAAPAGQGLSGPGPIASTGKEVTDETPLTEGMILQAQWKGAWWAAVIEKILPDGEVRIHYLGLDAEWDEDVPRSRLQLDPDAAKKAGVKF